MALNLISDAWIPVVCQNGARKVIAPWQITDKYILRPDWPRPDLNIACLEMLIGMVFMADPPHDIEDWDERPEPNAQRLRQRLDAFAPAFNLLGDGPRFLQDLEKIDGEVNGVDMLFIDSAGASTASKNADLLVHRNRYEVLDLPLAAMALFTFQAHAPAGGAGNRTSMRGGGPMVTLLDPQTCLWDLIWANVPDGNAAAMDDLPWMRPTNVSQGENRGTRPPDGKRFKVEAFFGMPRRLRLVNDGEKITGVIQRPWGANYAMWVHPLSPYYRMKAGDELLPKHPRAGRFGYRNWLGVIAESDNSELAERALVVANNRAGQSVIVAGWSMDNMKPRDFILSHQPNIPLDVHQQNQLRGMIKAAETVAVVLRGALASILFEGEAREAQRETFFIETEAEFLRLLPQLVQGNATAFAWFETLKKQALTQFEQMALPGMDQRNASNIQKIVEARKMLSLTFAGYTKLGRDLFGALEMPLPISKKGKTG